MAYVIQHLSLSPTSWYGGPLSRWVTSLGSAVSYATAADAQAVIDLYRMYAVPAVNPPGQVSIVSMPSSTTTANLAAFGDTTGTALVDGGSPTGRLRGVTTINVGSGTYTPTAGTGLIEVEMVGGGGGGGGVPSPTGTNVAVASGGAAAGYARKFYLVGLATFTYVCGAKGTGGAAGANNGTAGADTTFTSSLAGTATASGGAGGAFGLSSGAPQNSSFAIGGAASGGDLNIAGQSSNPGLAPVTGLVLSGAGGNGQLGRGGRAVSAAGANTTLVGVAATGFGGGGGGAAASGTGAANAGGDGTPGVIIIREYSGST